MARTGARKAASYPRYVSEAHRSNPLSSQVAEENRRTTDVGQARQVRLGVTAADAKRGTREAKPGAPLRAPAIPFGCESVR